MNNNKTFTRTAVARAISLLLGSSVVMPLHAQEQQTPAADSAEIEVIQVRGVRGSLQEAADIKRNSMGVVDAISSEDIGKFPDTNLAESLQRISGVSISRTNGEGSEVTVRGFGGDNNMVTLNGRTMPSATTYGAGSGADGTTRGGSARAFDFSNLASESIRAVEVYKTGKANIAT
ncbi:MAG: TonB-dependent receptor plug domain-containing protein, partial [Rheinheimera sp.]